jgi:hypothetical protein
LFALKGNDASKYHMLKLVSISKEDKREVYFYLIKVALDTEASCTEEGGGAYYEREKLNDIYDSISKLSDFISFDYKLDWYDSNGKLICVSYDFNNFEKIYNLKQDSEDDDSDNNSHCYDDIEIRE